MRAMPQKRNPENKGFPPRWRWKNGAIYYQVPKGLEYKWDGKQLFRLGKTPSEAHKEWAKRVEPDTRNATIGSGLTRYELEVIPTKAPQSQINDRGNIRKLRAVFGDMLPEDFEPKHAYQFIDKSTGKVWAKRQIALLSHVFTKMIEWGYIRVHPFKGQVRFKGEKPRRRFVEDWEIEESVSLEPFRKTGSVLVIQAYILLKLVIAQRCNDTLMIRMEDLREDGIHITPHKTSGTTGVTIIIKWTDAVRAAVALALAARPVDISPWLFCNEFGQCYYNVNTGTAHGWKSMWHRFMNRVLAETKVTERFNDKDLRAKAGSESQTLELAQQLLGHSNSAITDRVYRRKPKFVDPVK